jgi:hypothetical protein
MNTPAASSTPTITGVVSGFTSRFEEDGRKQQLVWNFSLVTEDTAHQRFYVPVQMRGVTFDGAIQDGDIISVDAVWRPGDTVHANSVINVRTRATIVANSKGTPPSRLARTISVVFIVIFVGAFAFLLIGAVLAGLGIVP